MKTHFDFFSLFIFSDFRTTANELIGKVRLSVVLFFGFIFSRCMCRDNGFKWLEIVTPIGFIEIQHWL